MVVNAAGRQDPVRRRECPRPQGGKIMRWKTSLVVGALVAAVQSTLLASNSGTGIEGAWLIEVTLRDCATNAPIGAINSLVSFHDGGTISETPSRGAFALGQRSDGHGRWAHRNARTFRQRMVALIQFDTAANLPGTPGFDPTKPITPGFFAGWQTVTHVVELVDANHLQSSGTNAFYKSSGELYRSGCSTATGERFK